MQKKISFLILSHTGSKLKQATVSIGMLRLLFIVFVGSLVFFGYILKDYTTLKNSLFAARRFENKNTNLQDEIIIQRKQIQKFADEITGLKEKLVALNNFEKKIRIIANIDTVSDQDGLFGIGGSIPADLDTKIPITEKHNSLIRAMHERSNRLDTAMRKQEQGFESLLKSLEGQLNLLASTPAIRPTKGWITCRFGYRISPFTGLREFHKGLDIATRKGTPIIATANGIVT